MLIGISHTEDKYCVRSQLSKVRDQKKSNSQSEWSSRCHGYQKSLRGLLLNMRTAVVTHCEKTSRGSLNDTMLNKVTV